ncbi:Sulfate ABC transporter, periplasmic sulfate-binding protein OS=Tsukamurella paurometabola (strain ATCC 8368 / DSM / CCUG 35730 / CIP 100753 / JCM 10117/ KCTC 9821 / NBRC 16120 / NCIMB 702349 / NCTC 13040) OX=521096 GN=Tpau_2780 PE=3 SV=1 [Tsukamurella paurometabola]|uniref:Sulfate ABC transporter, periplasmic sulfate-binding protein n=1 Tax=Tsukamurella paurometabola (strain ATCC 8368 / DSM 20162 / CCUG 35730 / CIP 100753 / JCM 10117 / KCTC 9821 / NBRC 16120 / NCIMB 702349 / NCTC 13040) TaxID=521096 RepID=D5UT93_TSUPD|nr:sulfate ABC transporter substrate-binding protein [Tsukamurella paurometabola]ADG79378.1 sulfate ABC transporter, periplasmic sulfate- binding protein [Tsukamurella paurometabola DSM 20162]SUP35463.1 Sulfate starvation-induced protein 2 [Tsukamurella paurometabola]
MIDKTRRGAAALSQRGRAQGIVVIALSLLLAACGGGSTDVPHGADISSGRYQVNLVGFAAAKPAFDVAIPLFRATNPDVGFSQSYGASGDQSRKVARHVPADVVNFSVQPDVTRDVKAGVIDKTWEKAYPYDSVPFTSLVAVVVRPGNPKNIRDWKDLLKPGVEVVTPNPASSGSAKWNLLAPYAALSDGGKNPKQGLDFVKELIRDHTTVSPGSGRDATAAFDSGQGDVLLSYESEAVLMQRQNKADGKPPVEYLFPPQTFRIELPVAVVNTAQDPDAAERFVKFLFTPEAQRALPESGFRASDPEVAAATSGLFGAQPQQVWTIKQLGAELGKGTAAKNNGKDLAGWPAVDAALFGEKGTIAAAYKSGGK